MPSSSPASLLDWTPNRQHPHLSMSPTLLQVLAIATLLLTGPAQGLAQGPAYFVPTGMLVSSTSFHTVKLEIPLSVILRAANSSVSKADWAIEELGKRLLKEFDFTSDKADAFLTRAKNLLDFPKRRLSQAVGKLTKMISFEVQERQALLALAAVGEVLAIGSGLYALEEVKRLNGIADKNAQHIKTLATDLTRLEELTDRWMKEDLISDHLADEAMAIGQELAAVTEHLDLVLEGIYAAKQHKLTSALVPPEVLIRMSDKVKEHAKYKKLTPVFDVRHHALDMPISYIMGTESLAVLCHIPMVEDKDSMVRKLYRLDSAVMQSRDRLVQIRPHKPYIAVDKREQKHSEHDLADLDLCPKMGTTYLCTERSIVYRESATCVGAVYFQNSALMTVACPVVDYELKLPAIQLTETEFMVAADQQTTMKCGERRPSFEHTKEDTRVTVPRGCTLSSPEFEATPAIMDLRQSINVSHELILPDYVAVDATINSQLGDDLNLDILGDLDSIRESTDKVAKESTNGNASFVPLKGVYMGAGTGAMIVIFVALIVCCIMKFGLRFPPLCCIRSTWFPGHNHDPVPTDDDPPVRRGNAHAADPRDGPAAAPPAGGGPSRPPGPGCRGCSSPITAPPAPTPAPPAPGPAPPTPGPAGGDTPAAAPTPTPAGKAPLKWEGSTTTLGQLDPGQLPL